MTIEYDEKGKFYTDIVPKVAIPSTIQTVHQLIKGFIHIRHGKRVKDELDRDEAFLAVTKASVLGSDGKVLFEAPFMALARAQIVWIMPHEDETVGANRA
jgi:hypothetical protein